MEDLDIDSTQQFIPVEILSFVPWIKHHDVGEAEAHSVLEKWSSAAFAEISLGLKRAVLSFSDTSKLLAFRERIFQIWLPASFSTRKHSGSEIFEALRSYVNTRMKDLLRAEAEALPVIASEIGSALERDDSSTQLFPLSIWHHDYVTAPVGKGAFHFKKQLVDVHLGQSKTTDTILSSLQKWTSSMSASLERIQHLRKIRWVDVIEEQQEESDEEERTDKIEKALQKEDPGLYEQELMSSLATSTLQFEGKMKEISENLDTAEVHKAVFLLRAIRGIHQRLTASFPQQDLKLLSSAVPHLHRLLATSTATTLLLETIKYSPLALTKRKAKALTHLWEGDPPLPTQPSPRVFQLLQRLTAIIAEQGPDIWSPDAVAAVKKAVRKTMMDSKLLRADSRGAVSGARGRVLNGDGDDKHGDEGEAGEQAAGAAGATVAIQNLFNMLYLSNALRISGEDSDGKAASEGPLESATFNSAIRHAKRSVSRHLDPAAMSMLEERAREYWARTSLLFGLLVAGVA
jgi:conserved oligomeric Golgi complex subunit 1